MRWASVLVALLVASGGWPDVAYADPRSTVTLEWKAPGSCPSRVDMERDVRKAIGGRAVDRDPLVARVEVWRASSGGWNAEVQLSAAEETVTRRLEGPTCRAVASAVAIVVGVAAVEDSSPVSVQPGTPSTIPVPTPASPVAPSAPPPPPTPVTFPSAELPVPSVAKPAPARPVASARPSRVVVGAAALLDVGSVPAATPGVEGFVGWKPAWWDIEVGGGYLATQAAPLGTNAGKVQSAAITREEAMARACGAWGGPRFEAGPCLGANLAWLQGQGQNATHTEQGASNTAGGTVGARATLHLTRWAAAYIGADLLVPFYRPRFVISGTEYRVSAAAFRGGLGLEAYF